MLPGIWGGGSRTTNAEGSGGQLDGGLVDTLRYLGLHGGVVLGPDVVQRMKNTILEVGVGGVNEVSEVPGDRSSQMALFARGVR